MYQYSPYESFESQFRALAKALLLKINPSEEMRTVNTVSKLNVIEPVINPVESYLPFVGDNFKDEATVYRHINGCGHFEVLYSERGSRKIVFSTSEYNELVYHYIKSVIRQFALTWELKNRIKEQDSRRLWFQKSVELIEIVSSEYARELQSEYDEILKRRPFSD